MKKLSITEFSSRCSFFLEHLRKSRQPIIITKFGKPIARIIPVARPTDILIGRLQGIILVSGDIESPIQPADDWESARR